jgi:hypothetical protein
VLGLGDLEVDAALVRGVLLLHLVHNLGDDLLVDPSHVRVVL